MMTKALERVKTYLKVRKWEAYLVILPTTLLVEKFMQELMADAEVQGILEPQIFTFESFAEKMIKSSHAATVWIGEVEKSEILRNCILDLQQQGQLGYFLNIERHPGIVRSIAQNIGEMKRAVATPDKLKKAVGKFASAKMSDLWIIYSTYQELLAIYNLGDRDDRYMQVLDLLSQNGVSPLYNVEFAYIDWFEDPTGVQTEIFRLIAEQVPEVCNASQHIITTPQEYPATIFVQGWGREGEVRRVAVIIKNLVANEGRSLEDIVLVCRNPTDYSGTLHKVFAEAGIPLFLDWKEPLGTNKLIKSIFLLLQAAGGERAFRLCELLDNDYVVGTDKKMAAFISAWSQNYFELTSDEWVKKFEAARANQETANYCPDWDKCSAWLKQFLSIVNSIPLHGPIMSFINSIRTMLKSLQVEKNMVTFADDITLAEKISLQRRDVRAWLAFNRILDEMDAAAKLGGDIYAISLNEFIEQLMDYTGSESYSPDIINRGGVRVMSPTQIRGLEYEYVIALGMQEGEFPRAISSDWVINDRERLQMRSDIYLSISGELYQRERALFNMVLKACRKRLWLCYPVVDNEGQAVLPSLYLEDVKQQSGLWQGNDEPLTVVFPVEVQQSCSLRELILVLMKQGHKDTAISLAGREPELKQHLQSLDQVNSFRWGNDFSPWDGCFNRAAIIAQLSAKCARRMFSAGILNHYANCPMQYFLARELELKPLPAAETELNHLDKGVLQHQVLQRVFSGNTTLNDREIPEVVAETLEKICRENNFTGQQYPDPWLWELEKRVIRDNLINLVISELERLKRSQFHPAMYEWGFGLQGEDMDKNSVRQPLVIKTPHTEVSLCGKVDRIDIHEDGMSYAVYDYKNRSGDSKEKMLQGKALQLPVYLVAVEKFLGKTAAAAYLSIMKGKTDASLVRAEMLKDLGMNRQTRALSEEGWMQLKETTLNAVGEYYEGIAAGQFPPAPGDCRYCEFSRICLYDPGRLRAKFAGKGADRNEA